MGIFWDTLTNPVELLTHSRVDDLNEQLKAIDAWVNTVTDPRALQLASEYKQWRTSTSFLNEAFNIDTVLEEAKKRRSDIQVAQGDPDLVALGFHPADLPNQDATVVKQPLLDKGDAIAIKVLQRALKLPESGVLDARTKLVLIAFQKSKKIDPANGTVGPHTWSALGIANLVQAKADYGTPFKLPWWAWLLGIGGGAIVVNNIVKK